MVTYLDGCRKTEAFLKPATGKLKSIALCLLLGKLLGNSCQGITESYQCIVGPELLSPVGLIVYLLVLCAILTCFQSFHMSEQLGE